MSKSINKVLRTTLDDNLNKKFEVIKDRLGLSKDAEVIRYLIQDYFLKNFEKTNE